MCAVWSETSPTYVIMIVQAILTTYIPNKGMAINSLLVAYE